MATRSDGNQPTAADDGRGLGVRGMTRFPPMPNRSFNDSRIEDRIFERLQSRIWPIGVSIVFLILGLLFYFRWASVVSHSPSQWWSPGDLWDSFRASTTLVQGNFNGYSQWVFRGFGGRLILLAPLAAIKGAFSTTFVQIRDHGHLLAHPIVLHASGLPFNTTSIAHWARSSTRFTRSCSWSSPHLY
jgi:hypothetical protein